jgi:hypothetical protein
MELLISQGVRKKLANKQPPVSEENIRQCFANKIGRTLMDTREKNASTPPTRWFIAEMDSGFRLKVCLHPQSARWSGHPKRLCTERGRVSYIQ